MKNHQLALAALLGALLFCSPAAADDYLQGSWIGITVHEEAYDGVCGCDFSNVEVVLSETFLVLTWWDYVEIVAGDCTFTFSNWGGSVVNIIQDKELNELCDSSWYFDYPNAEAGNGGCALGDHIESLLMKIRDLPDTDPKWSAAVDELVLRLRHDMKLAGVNPEADCEELSKAPENLYNSIPFQSKY